MPIASVQLDVWLRWSASSAACACTALASARRLGCDIIGPSRFLPSFFLSFFLFSFFLLRFVLSFSFWFGGGGGVGVHV